ncbi:hypothetical protein LLG46_02365 [bacterium]|nr:hypothetical protein [bacterium]
MEQLISNLTNAGLIDGTAIILDQFQRVDIADFETFFGSTDGSYDQLCTADDNGDGTTKGYKRFFDEWHAAGII